MPDGYFHAFTAFLQSGRREALAPFIDGNAEPRILDVYRNGFLKACTEVLRSSYPSVAQLVGDDCFTALARRYVAAHPPRTASLVEYGDGFAATVEDIRNVHGLAYLGCIAKLDRAWTEVYFAADTQTPEPAALAGMNEDAIMELRGRLACCVRLLSLEFAALDAWARMRRGVLRSTASIPRAPQHALVWRSGAGVAFRSLGVPEHALVAGIAAGKTLADAAEHALDRDAAFDIGAAFAHLLAERMLILENVGSHEGHERHGGPR